MASAEVHHHPSLASNSSLKHSFSLSLFSHSLFLLQPFCCSLSLLYIFIPSLIFFYPSPFLPFLFIFSPSRYLSIYTSYIHPLCPFSPFFLSFSHYLILYLSLFSAYLARTVTNNRHHWLPCPQLDHLNFLSQTSRLHYKLALLYWGLFLYISFVVRKANFSPKNQAEMRK